MTTNRRFSLALDSLNELRLHEGSGASTQPTRSASSAGEILAKLGPLPREALFLGIASDGLPVLLNLHDPHPGPMLIAGDDGSGKTRFLQSIASSVAETHQASEVQFAVITGQPAEWENAGSSAHRVGVFHAAHTDAQDLVRSLAAWAHSNKSTKQSILLLADDLESIARMDFDALQSFRWLLLRGPARRVWPFITLNAGRYGQVLAWIEIFRTRVFGRIADLPVAQALGGDGLSALDQLDAGREFSLRENSNWLRFTLASF